MDWRILEQELANINMGLLALKLYQQFYFSWLAAQVTSTGLLYGLNSHMSKHLILKDDLLFTEKEIEELKSNKFNSNFDTPNTSYDIDEFKTFIIENFTAYDIDLSLNNLEHVTIQKYPKLFGLLFGRSGNFNPRKNKVSVFSQDSLEHELYHAMTSLGGNWKKAICGFHQVKGLYSIGKTYNEGYTTLLERRNHGSGKDSYNNEVKITELTELLFDEKEEFGQLYLDMNLHGLLDKLSSYSSRAEALKFIAMTDLVTQLPVMGFPLSNHYSSKCQLELYKIILMNFYKTDCNKVEEARNIIKPKGMSKKLINKYDIAEMNKLS